MEGTASCLLSGVLLVLALVLLTGRVTIAFVTFVGLAAVLNIFFAYLTVRDYTFGMIESIAITIFIGFACDYCVHIAQTHICTIAEIGSLDVVHKIKHTLGHAGPALFSSALTTAGSALPLLFCNIFVFRQMGEFIAVCCRPSVRGKNIHSHISLLPTDLHDIFFCGDTNPTCAAFMRDERHYWPNPTRKTQTQTNLLLRKRTRIESSEEEESSDESSASESDE